MNVDVVVNFCFLVIFLCHLNPERFKVVLPNYRSMSVKLFHSFFFHFQTDFDDNEFLREKSIRFYHDYGTIIAKQVLAVIKMNSSKKWYRNKWNATAATTKASAKGVNAYEMK